MRRDVCIVIPTYNRAENLSASLEHNKHCFEDVRVYLIDASDEMFTPMQHNVTCVKAAKKGQLFQKHQGVQLAMENGFRWVIFLDDDIFLMDDFWTEIQNFIDNVPSKFTAGSFNLVDKITATHLSSKMLNFTGQNGKLFKSTYTSPMNGDGYEVRWCLGGAAIWSVKKYLETEPEFSIVGKAFCEDIFTSTFFASDGYYFLSKCKAYERDSSSMNMTANDMWDYAKAEYKARIYLAEKRPKVFSKGALAGHALWRSLIFICAGVVTFSLKRIYYGLSLLISVSRLSV